MVGAERSSPSTPETRRAREVCLHAESPATPLHRAPGGEEGRPDGSRCAETSPGFGRALISPFELQHQIFREHPAPEQLFLIATSQHCCPCLYINIYTVPWTEHQSPALLPPPVPSRASPAPLLAARPGRRAAAPRWASGRAAAPAQSLAGCARVPYPLLTPWSREKREATSFPHQTFLSCLWQRLGPDSAPPPVLPVAGGSGPGCWRCS